MERNAADFSLILLLNNMMAIHEERKQYSDEDVKRLKQDWVKNAQELYVSELSHPAAEGNFGKSNNRNLLKFCPFFRMRPQIPHG